MILRIYDLSDRQIGCFSTPCSDRWGKIKLIVAETFNCAPDDVDSLDTDDCFDVLTVKGQAVARLVSSAGWAA